MKPLRFVFLFMLLIAGSLPGLNAQDEQKKDPKLIIGIDFVRYNRDWIYYSDVLQPIDGTTYGFDLIPSLYVKLPFGNQALRFKYEFFKKPYSFVTNSVDLYQEIEGNLVEHRLSLGYEINLYDKSFSIYYLTDCGVSFTNFAGQYSTNNIDNSIFTDAFNIDGVTLFIQAGLGFKFKLSNRLDLNLESALWVGKGFDRYDIYDVNPDLRFIPRPISLLGLSYKIFNK